MQTTGARLPRTTPAPVRALHAGRMRAPRISCVIPCFNEAAHLRRLLPLLTGFLGARFAAWEIVLVVNAYDNTLLFTDLIPGSAIRWLQFNSSERDTALI